MENEASHQRKFWGLSLSLQNLITIVGGLVVACGMYYSLKADVANTKDTVTSHTGIMTTAATAAQAAAVKLQEHETRLDGMDKRLNSQAENAKEITAKLNELSNGVSVLLDRTDPKNRQR